MRRAILPAILAMLSISVVSVSAQSTGRGSGEATIEELYLQSTEIRIINEQARNGDREMKIMALENIQEMIDAGRRSTGAPDAHYVLDYLAGEGIGHEIRENRRLINYYPEVRRRAANLLGKLGGENSKDSLLKILLSDNESMVLAEAAYALGQIGLNDNDEVTEILADVILSQDILNPDNNFAFASLLAYQKIARKNGGIDDPSAFEAIIRIAQGNYIKDVRMKAVQVLNELRTYN